MTRHGTTIAMILMSRSKIASVLLDSAISLQLQHWQRFSYADQTSQTHHCPSDNN